MDLYSLYGLVFNMQNSYKTNLFGHWNSFKSHKYILLVPRGIKLRNNDHAFVHLIVSHQFIFCKVQPKSLMFWIQECFDSMYVTFSLRSICYGIFILIFVSILKDNPLAG